MRRYAKQQLLDMLTTLVSAEKHLRKSYKRNQQDEFVTLLQDCQDAAMTIGETIERSEGEGTDTVMELERYCELLWQCHEASGEQMVNSLCKKMVKSLHKVETLLKAEISVQYEIVFLPYKVSMWDALETIWMAARKDRHCCCKVIPIPYFERNQDGSFGQMFDEYELFPEYVKPILHTEYHLEQERPDVIFIHNPYDQNNRVTSVHPDYYSERLKQYTSLLAYVPYYISNNDNDEDWLCLASGVLHADKVFLQSEVIRTQFIEVLKHTFQMNEKQIKAGNVNDKYLALGTPKADRLITENRSNIHIPQEWNNTILDKTGRQKKICFYNTTLTELLSNLELLMKKTSDLIELFEGEDKVLLWRPHPLSLSTIKSMLPQYYEEYLHLVEKFKKLDNGIYDESTDSQRTVILADAYIGDEISAMVKSFGITGKPMLFMNYKSDLPGITLRTISGAICGDDLWFFHCQYNALFRMNLETNQTSFAGAVEGLENRQSMFDSVVTYKERLFFIPYMCNSIIEVHTQSGRTKRILLEEKAAEEHYHTVLYNDKIYLFSSMGGRGHHYILHPETDDIEAFQLPELAKLEYVNESPAFWDCKRYEESVFFLCRQKPYMVEYVFKSGDIRIHKYIENVEFWKMEVEGDNIWILTKNPAALIKWNRASGFSADVREIPVKEEPPDRSIPPFSKIFYSNGYLWMIPVGTKQILKVNVQTGKIIDIDLKNKNLRRDFEGGELFGSFSCCGQWLYLLPQACNVIYKINLETDGLVELPVDSYLQADAEQIKKSIVEYSAEHIYREQYCEVKDFLKLLEGNEDDRYTSQRAEFFRHNLANADGTAGCKIWEYIKTELEQGG